MRTTGKYQLLGNLNYFIPDPLPPSNPELHLSSETINLYGKATFMLGKLNEMSSKLPDSNRFIKAYVIKEALLSSSIEGVHTTLIDVFTHTLDTTTSKPSKETQLIVNYTQALESAISMLKNENFPLTLRVLSHAHQVLMSSEEGNKANPGNFRKQSVRVGNLTPPPAQEIPDLMANLERYINEDSDIPPLIRAGLVHVIFETIHPFLDGNGRLGRLLIVLMMIHDELLLSPILYPSYYFKKHHFEYYQKLDRVRTEGDFEGWILFYLKAIHESALDAYNRAKEIEELESMLQQKIMAEPDFIRIQKTASQTLHILFSQPIIDVSHVSKNLGKAYNTAQNVLTVFVKHGILSESIINKRNKLYTFEPYIALLEKEY